MAHNCNLCTLKAEAGGLMEKEFDDDLDYRVKRYLTATPSPQNPPNKTSGIRGIGVLLSDEAFAPHT